MKLSNRFFNQCLLYLLLLQCDDAQTSFTKIRQAECHNCSKDENLFLKCLIVSEMLRESCVECHCNSKNVRCLFRPKKCSPPAKLVEMNRAKRAETLDGNNISRSMLMTFVEERGHKLDEVLEG